MFTLFDYLKYNNVPFAELKEGEGKEKIKRFVKKLEEEKLKDLILSFGPPRSYNIREFDPGVIDTVSSLPDDLSHKMLRCWVYKDDPEFHL